MKPKLIFKQLLHERRPNICNYIKLAMKNSEYAEPRASASAHN